MTQKTFKMDRFDQSTDDDLIWIYNNMMELAEEKNNNHCETVNRQLYNQIKELDEFKDCPQLLVYFDKEENLLDLYGNMEAPLSTQVLVCDNPVVSNPDGMFVTGKNIDDFRKRP